MNVGASDWVRFAGFELNFRTGELSNGDGKTVLQDQPFQILRLLIEADGKLVSREEIKNKLWPNDTIVEFDHSINAAIKNLRRALGDSAEDPRYVETLSRRGYRLMVRTEWLKEPTSSSDVAGGGGGTAVRLQPEPGMIGRKVSHYRVLEVIGGGGMGMVYKAEDLKLGRRVALKFLPEDLARDPVALQRFEREARTASLVSHPNICTIYEVEEYENQPVLVMELLQGETLRDRLTVIASRKEHMPLDEQLSIALQVIEGLEAAHEQCIIHRDIKPANIFLTSSGQVKILDFGLAKLVTTLQQSASDGGQLAEESLGAKAAAGAPSGQSIDETLTRTGSAMGTAGYMSPEQVRGDKLDARTDLFSFGLVLYELSTGQRAFMGETAAIVQDAILNQEPTPIRQINSEAPPKLISIIDKALAKDRERRYQQAREMQTDLHQLNAELQPRTRNRWKLTATLGLVATLLALSLVVAARLAWRARLTQTPPPVRIERITTEGNVAGSATISADGAYIVYAVTEQGSARLWVRQLATATSTSITGPVKGGFWGTTFSPHNDYIYYVQAGGSLYRVSRFGGTPQMLASGVRGPVSFSPDGSKIAYKSGRVRVIIANQDGTQPQVLFSRDLHGAFDPGYGTSWSADGKLIAIAAMNGKILVIDLLGNVKELTPVPDGQIWRVQWLPDSSGLVFVGIFPDPHGPDRLFLVSYPSGECKPITAGTGDYNDFSLGVTADGNSILGLPSIRATNLWLTSDFHHYRQLTENRMDAIDALDFSGDRISYMSYEEGRSPVWVMNIDGSHLVQISPNGIRAEDPKFSPDGRQVSFAGRLGSNNNIWVAYSDGSNVRQVTYGNSDYHPSFTSDGKSILFHKNENEIPYLMKVSLDGGQPARLSNQWLDARTRPCAGLVLAQTRMGSTTGYALVSTDDGQVLQTFELPANATSAMCAPNGNISYIDTSNIWEMPAHGGAPKQLTHFSSDTIWNYAWSPDGKQLLLSRGPEYSDAILIHNFR